MEPKTKRENVPVVGVEALLKLADWLDGWKRRNPEAWDRIRRRRANAAEDGSGEAVGPPTPITPARK